MVFNEEGSIEWYDYNHIAPGDSDDELRQYANETLNYYVYHYIEKKKESE